MTIGNSGKTATVIHRVAALEEAESSNFDPTTGKASTATAEAGTNDTQWMSALKTKQSFKASDLQRKTLEKLKRDAVVYYDFCTNEGKEQNDLSVVRGDATSLITYTAPDGQTGITADGRVVTLPPGTPAIVSREGECQGLQVFPESTSLALWSEDFSQSQVRFNTTITTKTDQTCPLENKTVFQLDSSDGGITYIAQNYTTTVGQIYSLSRYVKFETGNESYGFTTIESQTVIIELNDFGVPTTNASVYNFFATKLKDGWWRIGISVIASATTMNVQYNVSNYPESNTNASTGIQFEQGYPTPYIKTEGGQIARSAAKSITTLNAPLGDTFSLYFDGILKGGDGSELFHGIIAASPTTSSGSDTGALSVFEDREGGRIRCAAYNTDVSGSDHSISDASTYTPNSRFKLLACVDKQNGVLSFYSNGTKLGELTGITFDNPDWDDLTKILQGAGLRFENDQGNGYQHRMMDMVIPYFVQDAEAVALTTLEDE